MYRSCFRAYLYRDRGGVLCAWRVMGGLADIELRLVSCCTVLGLCMAAACVVFLWDTIVEYAFCGFEGWLFWVVVIWKEWRLCRCVVASGSTSLRCVSAGLWMCALFVVGRRLWTPCSGFGCVVVGFACSLNTKSSTPNAYRYDIL